MSVKAYVLITAKTTLTRQVTEAVRRVEGIREVNEVMGPYDIVAEVETDQFDRVTDLVRSIRPIKGVLNTLTCVVMPPARAEKPPFQSGR